ncbi:MAG: SurA N-terminal domain-containing protein [Candidatus Puniceispirillales bacterium]
MLRALRNKSQSFLFKIFLVLIVIGFAAWGVGDLTGNKIPPVFKSNDFEISYEQIIYDFNKSRATNTGVIDVQTAIQNGFLNNVLISNKAKLIINQEAQYLDLNVPRLILKKQISENDQFKENLNNQNVFSEKKFNTLLRNNNISENEYLENLQLQILNGKIFNHIYDIKNYSTFFSTDFYKWQNRKLDLNYIFTPYLKKINEPIDEDAKITFYNNYKNNFRIPKLRNLSYVSFKPNLLYDDIIISEEQIANSYYERISEFKTPETRNYFQVVFDTKQKAENFYKKVLNNNDFITQSKLLNFNENDVKFDKISKDDLTKNIKDKIFNIQNTGLIKPFKTNFGFHVVQINKIDKEKVQLINEVKDVIKKDLLYNSAIEKLYEKIELINDLAFSGNNLNEIIKLSEIKNLKIIKISNISKNGDVYTDFKPKKSNFNEKFLDETWKLQLNEISELLEIEENEFVLINVNNEIEEKQLSYSEAEKLVSEKLYEKLKVQNTKLKSENNFKNINSDNLNKILNLNRIENKNLSKVFNNYVINNIFKSKIGELKSIKTPTGILTFKILKENFNQKIDKKFVDQIDYEFKENMLSDIQTFYYKNFENFHKIKSNLKSLDSLVNPNQ